MAAVALADLEKPRGRRLSRSPGSRAGPRSFTRGRRPRRSSSSAGERRGRPVTRPRRRIDEQTADEVEEVVAGGAVHRPASGRSSPRLEDLLGDDPGLRGGRPQPLEVPGRVPQAIGMVDPEAVEHAVARSSEHQRVRVGEDLLVLDAQADQGGDVEEAPIVEVAARGPPVGEAVVLRESMASSASGSALTASTSASMARRDLGLLRRRGARAARRTSLSRWRRRRSRGRRRSSAAARRRHRRGRPGRRAARPPAAAPSSRPGSAARPAHGARDSGPRTSRPRALQPQLAGLEDAAVVVAQDRQQDEVPQVRLGRVPVDVEVAGVAARRAVLQHVPPPGVLGARDRHVVGDDVEDLAEALAPQGPAESAPVSVVAAELLVDAVRVDHVVAVLAAGRRLEERGRVEVADPESLEVGSDSRGRPEAERRGAAAADRWRGPTRRPATAASRRALRRPRHAARPRRTLMEWAGTGTRPAW